VADDVVELARDPGPLVEDGVPRALLALELELRRHLLELNGAELAPADDPPDQPRRREPDDPGDEIAHVLLPCEHEPEPRDGEACEEEHEARDALAVDPERADGVQRDDECHERLKRGLQRDTEGDDRGRRCEHEAEGRQRPLAPPKERQRGAQCQQRKRPVRPDPAACFLRGEPDFGERAGEEDADEQRVGTQPYPRAAQERDETAPHGLTVAPRRLRRIRRAAEIARSSFPRAAEPKFSPPAEDRAAPAP
jgi:hypothetical protein